MSGMTEYKWCLEVKPAPAILVLAGAAGNLAGGKLFNALAELGAAGLWPEGSRVIGCARREWSDDDFRRFAAEHISAAGGREVLRDFIFVPGDLVGAEFPPRLKAALDKVLARWRGATAPALIFHFAVGAAELPGIAAALGGTGFFDNADRKFREIRVILEKPLGLSGADAEALAAGLRIHLKEAQIYRMDHFLGKDFVRNLLVTRFANRIFEPAWNSSHISEIIICAAERDGVEGRAGYYDRSGCIRDMFQNHLLEMLALTAMERPRAPGSAEIEKAKLRLLGRMRAASVRTARYSGYANLPGVAGNSRTETAALAVLEADTPRWRGTRFTLLSGKAMARDETWIKVRFRSPDCSPFRRVKAEDFAGDELKFELRPREGMSLRLQVKMPGPNLCVGSAELDFTFPAEAGAGLSAYARLFVEAMLGERDSFATEAFSAAGWRIFDPVLERLAASPDPPAEYPPGIEPGVLFPEIDR